MIRKLFLLTVISVFLPSMVLAAPFVVCNPYPPTGIQPDNFKVTMDGGAVINSAPQSIAEGVRLHYDVGSIAVGSHHMTVSACKTYPADEWNPDPVEACSATVPFDFIRPAEGTSPNAPASIKLLSQ